MDHRIKKLVIRSAVNIVSAGQRRLRSRGHPPHWSIYSVTLEFDTTTRKWPSSSAAASGVLVRHHRKWCWRDLYLLIVWWTDKFGLIRSSGMHGCCDNEPQYPCSAVLPFDAHFCHIGTAIIYKTSCAVPDRVKPLLFSTSGHSDAQPWASECPGTLTLSLSVRVPGCQK